MTITGGSALRKDDIQRMVDEAEKYAEEDARRREEAETRNRADTLVYTTEKFLAENADKVPEDIKSEVESALGDVKKALEGTDLDAIKEATEKAAQVSQKMGTAMYAQAQASASASSSDGDAAGSGDEPADDDVVEAEIVDEEKPSEEGGAA